MNSLAGWLRANRVARIFFIALSFPLPPTNLLSGMLVVFAVLAAGWRAALADAAIALAILCVAIGMTGGPWVSVAAGAVLLWGGCVVGAQLAGATRSVGLAFQLLVVLAVLAVPLAWLIAGAPQLFWRPVIDEFFANANLADAMPPAEMLDWMAGMMHGVLAGSLLSSALFSLLGGCWLAQPLTGMPVRELFLNIRLGRVLGTLALIVLATAFWPGWMASGNLLFVFAIGFAAQGIAVVHWTAARRGWPKWWALALYLPPLLSPALAGVVLSVVVIVGLGDNWVGLRRPAQDVV